MSPAPGSLVITPDHPKILPVDSGCWLWTGCVSEDGYAKTNKKAGSSFVHRVMYQRIVGPISEGLELDHSCKVRNCVNPEHLEPVTPKLNKMRARGWVAASDSEPLSCKRDHDLTKADSIYTTPDGRRRCRACQRLTNQRCRNKHTEGSEDQ